MSLKLWIQRGLCQENHREEMELRLRAPGHRIPSEACRCGCHPLLIHTVIDHMDFDNFCITCVPALTVPCPAALRTVSYLYKTGYISSFLKPSEDSPLLSNTQNPSGGLTAPAPSSALARLAHTFSSVHRLFPLSAKALFNSGWCDWPYWKSLSASSPGARQMCWCGPPSNKQHSLPHGPCHLGGDSFVAYCFQRAYNSAYHALETWKQISWVKITF